jgi:hypothetical protein
MPSNLDTHTHNNKRPHYSNFSSQAKGFLSHTLKTFPPCGSSHWKPNLFPTKALGFSRQRNKGRKPGTAPNRPLSELHHSHSQRERERERERVREREIVRDGWFASLGSGRSGSGWGTKQRRRRPQFDPNSIRRRAAKVRARTGPESGFSEPCDPGSTAEIASNFFGIFSSGSLSLVSIFMSKAILVHFCLNSGIFHLGLSILFLFQECDYVGLRILIVILVDECM